MSATAARVINLSDSSEFGLSPEQFRNYGKQVIDWIADYLATREKYPVLAQVQPGDIKRQLPALPPSKPESMESILGDFDRIIMPGITHWNHPRYFAYFDSSGSAPGILGELLTATLNVNAMLWRTSPSATELEEVVMIWFRQMLGLPDTMEGVITDGASASSLLAIVAAREALDLDVRKRGMAGRADLPRLRMYTSEQAHSSVEKAGIVLGLGTQGVRKIAVDDEYRMNPAALAAAIDEDRRAGWLPFCVAATVGTTGTTSIDPVGEIADVCERERLWLHVDGAYGGTAAIVPEMRHVLDGCERADSIVINPHKWMFVPLDCSAFYTRHIDTLKRAFSLIPEYLRTSEGDADAVKNYMDYGIQLGRRFRALKLWFVIRSYGVEGLAAHIREHCRLAREFAAWIDADARFERLAPVPFSTVCFRYRPQGVNDETELEKINAKLMDAVNASGEIFISHAKIGDVFILRLAIDNMDTRARHVEDAWRVLRETAHKHNELSR